MKSHDILKVKNDEAGSASYVTESTICSLDVLSCTVLASIKFVNEFCREILISSVSVDHKLYFHEAQKKKMILLLKKRMRLREMFRVQNNIQHKLQ